jgi:hypothetical protein
VRAHGVVVAGIQKGRVRVLSGLEDDAGQILQLVAGVV